MPKYRVNFDDLAGKIHLKVLSVKSLSREIGGYGLLNIQKKCLFTGVKKDIMDTSSMVGSRLNTKMKR
ncbi:MAG: hypothetical protein ABIJ52_04550 [Pseudomonadota bacterium]